MPARQSPTPLSQRLSTAHWFALELGFDSNAEMLATMSRHEEEGQALNFLESMSTSKIRHLLRNLDDNITADLATINRRRSAPIVLKYFQYLAVLAAEYTLCRIADSPEKLAGEINSCLAGFGGTKPQVSPEHLNKLAFWMATGAGKTLIMHLNILQFRRYQHGIFTPDNTIIITPSDTMTAQHLAELKISGIYARPFQKNSSMFDDSVIVLDIHKLSEDTSKKGVTVSPKSFAGHNLIFVDEGHKGSSGGEKGYFSMRDRLVENDGFAFEYSATFGQAIAVANNTKRAEEYGRAILFDYSYRHFYQDNYGKDFFVVNASNKIYEESTLNRLMFANLLSFFQQQLAWQEHPEAREEFQIEKPLLLMLGATVTGGIKNADDDDDATDIIKITKFLHRVSTDQDAKKRVWTEAAALQIINGKSGIKNDDNQDLFVDKFEFLRQKYDSNAAALCARLRELVFHSDKKNALQFRPLVRGKANGQHPEIALQISGAAQPFALIYVGNSNKLVELAKAAGFTDINEFMRRPLFPHINDRESPINILIGAKKFMEGWSSWRVCGIGLLNVGKSEGPLIIQLFGRGVRLQGKNWSLKRSGGVGLSGNAKTAVQVLEMLNIFAVRADFMERFDKYLAREEVKLAQITVPIFSNEFDDKKLHYPSFSVDEKNNQGDKFNDFDQSDEVVILRPDDKIEVVIDWTSRYSELAGVDGQRALTVTESPSVHLDKLNDKIDENHLYFQVQRYINSRKWRNVVLSPAMLPEILKKCKIKQDTDESGSTPELLPGAKLQHIAFSAIKQYTDKVYGKARRLWEKKNMNISPLKFDGEGKHPNFVDYTVYVAADKVEKIKKAVETWKREGKNTGARIGGCYFVDVYFKRHLSQPLLSPMNIKSHLSPPGLNKGEVQFVEYLRDFFNTDNRREFLSEDAEIFLLRNLPKSGVCLTLEDGNNFYPDFMLWVLSGGRERLVFIDPKGLVHFGDDEYNKMEIWKYLRDISNSDKFRKKNFEMDSFIVSVTPYNKIGSGGKWSKEELHEEHVLFMDDLNPKEDEAAKLFSKMLMPS